MKKNELKNSNETPYSGEEITPVLGIGKEDERNQPNTLMRNEVNGHSAFSSTKQSQFLQSRSVSLVGFHIHSDGVLIPIDFISNLQPELLNSFENGVLKGIDYFGTQYFAKSKITRT